MMKALLIPILFVYACIFAGGYGALHNQISYTVSPEYFTQFKFDQFKIDGSVTERVGAAIVGWHASWWMGIAIGIVLIPLGLVIRGTKEYFWCMIKVYWIVALTALVVGLIALAISFLATDPANTGEEFTRFNNRIIDDAAFGRAGTMHNFSYAGGFAGIITGAIAILRYRGKSESRNKDSATEQE